MEEKFYCISRLTKGINGLESVDVHEVVVDGEISHYGIVDRDWMLNTYNFYDVKQIKKLENGNWALDGQFTFDGKFFKWSKVLPEVTDRHKTFLSYYHNEDQQFKERFTHLFNDLIVAKSVNDGDINSDNSDEYIKN